MQFICTVSEYVGGGGSWPLMEVRGQLAGVGTLLIPNEFHSLNSGLKTWCQASLSAKSFCWPYDTIFPLTFFYFLIKMYKYYIILCTLSMSFGGQAFLLTLFNALENQEGLQWEGHLLSSRITWSCFEIWLLIQLEHV